MRDRNNNPADSNNLRNENRHTDISSENIRNANASGDGSLSRSDFSFIEKDERFNTGEEDQELEQNY